MHRQFANLVALIVFCLSSGFAISPAVAVHPDTDVGLDFLDVEVEGIPVKRVHIVSEEAESNPFNLQSLHSESEAHPNLIQDDYNAIPTSSHPAAQSDENPPSSLSKTSLDGIPPVVASKTTPTKSSDLVMDKEDRPVTPFDHYHVLGFRPGSSDSTLEKRRLCPAQPRPSGRGCTCPNQTLCRRANQAPKCFQLKHDHENCGICFNRCGLTQYCQGGKCHCDRPNFSVCGKQCYNLKNNEEHCGKCGVACGRGKTCIQGACKRR